MESILHTLLPSDKTITSKFETVGHIAHINLRGHEEKHKHLIGQVILEKHKPKIRTVVNKIGAIENTFRVLPMEVIAGENDMEVELKESNCVFKFNFREVFWNSRLENEHIRLVSLCTAKDVVCDAFAGVGPFSVPLARKCVVYCNDLNPSCFESLLKNAKANLGKHKLAKLHAYNMDARDFIKHIVTKECYKTKGERKYMPITQVIMNLPMSAHEFLDAFIGIFPRECTILPLIHCYCFSNAESKHKQRAIEKIEKVLGAKIETKIVLKVRQTAANTKEYCISFVLPREIAYAKDSAEK